jgi:hypothetical protein
MPTMRTHLEDAQDDARDSIWRRRRPMGRSRAFVPRSEKGGAAAVVRTGRQ